MRRLEAIEKKILGGERLTDAEAEDLFQEKDILRLGRLADRVRRARHADRVYYRTDININQTNICVADCGFCAFYAKPGEKHGYRMTVDDVEAKVRAAAAAGVNEFHVVGGMIVENDLAYFEEMFRRLKAAAPGAEIQGLTAVEIDFLAKLEKLPLRTVLERLVAAGLDSIPGGGAEVFHPDARKRMMATKIAGDRFLEVHEVAHAMGLPTNVSILYGHVETPAERIDHLRRIRQMQDRTGGFRAFTLLRWNPEHTMLHKTTGAPGSTAILDLQMAAISRLYLDNVDHVKLPWVTIGKPMAQLALHFGVDDIGGSAFEERILEAAGGKTWQIVQKDDMPHLIRQAGFTPVPAFGSYEPIPSHLVRDAKDEKVVA